MTAAPAGHFLPRPHRPAMYYSPMLNQNIPGNELASPLSPYHAPIRPFVLCPEEESYQTSYLNDIISTWRHPIFATCAQKSPIPISLVFDYLANIRKCGEGVYGEVFKAYFRGLTEQRVYKVVPIEGSKIVNGEKQKKFAEIEPEIIVSQELNRLREGYNGCYTDGHCKLLYTRIVQGKYPAILIDQWKTWHRTYVSQNDLPSFDVTQMYVIFEFEFHGTDIESYKFRNAKQSLAVLLNVMHALAAAEAALEFEHRDLHWGNILVVKAREPYSTYTIQGTTFRVPNCGLKSTIIDYTISRLTSFNGDAVFTDLANDEDQFCGSEDYQFEIYRMMRQENQNDWRKFCPKTNIFWSHYLVGKLIEKGRYQDTTSATHLRFKNKLFRIQSNLLKYSSCMECARRFLSPFCRDVETDCM
jgi:serine/threonine-protein kinase haspin